VELLTVHVDGVAVDTGPPRRPDPPEDAGCVDADDAVVAGVGVTPSDADPTGSAVAVARTVRERATHLSADAVVLLPAPALVATSDASATARTLATVERWLRATVPVPAAPDESSVDVARASAGYHLAVEGSVRGHPHAVRRHRVPPDPPPTAPATPGGDAPTWRRVEPSGDESATDASPSDPPTDPTPLATDRLDAVPGLYREGTWLPGGVAARRAVVDAALDAFGTAGPEGDDWHEGDPLLIERGEGAGPPWREAPSTGTDDRPATCWIERSAPASGRPTVHVATADPAAAFATACDALATVLDRLDVDPVATVRGSDHAVDVAAAFDRPVLAGPEPPGDGRVDVSVTDAVAGLPVGRAWIDSRSPAVVGAAVGPPAAVLAATHAAAAAADRPLPARLAPTTVRLVPVADRHRDGCLALVDALRAGGVRADCDDRARTVAARLERVDAERLPYHAVVGDRELDGDAAAESVALPVVGPDGDQETWTVDDLVSDVAAATAAFPGRNPPAVPRRVSTVVGSQLPFTRRTA